MRKIPTVFLRDPDDMKHVLPEWHGDCLWVRDGEGTPTRKYDGTCFMLDGAGEWWARREVKPGKQTPSGFIPVEKDENSGKTVGWEPAEASGFAKWHAEALRNGESFDYTYSPGTYELIGPKVQGNPEDFPVHGLVAHDRAQVLHGVPRDPDGLRDWLLAHDFEGIVWHHEDGRMAKLKRRDFA